MTPQEMVELGKVVHAELRELAETEKGMSTAMFACFQEATRGKGYEEAPNFSGAGNAMAKALAAEKYLKDLRQRVGATGDRDFYSVSHGADRKTYTFWLSRRDGHAAYFDLVDRRAELEERRDRKIRAFLGARKK
ncbi:MAG: hypothetical protein H6837_21805 [Planctomycetes bacterium]|nr:hypothetical protein [Planctomycetota bacterium]